jgi:iron complex transport system substrate-binding protein
VSEVDDAIAFLGCTATVLTLDPMSLDEVIDSITTTGATTGAEARAAEIVASLRERVATVRERVASEARRSVLVLEWTDPAFTAGHWVPDLVEAAGGSCVLGRPGDRSEGVEWSTIRECAADVVIVAPCGFGLDGAADLAAGVIARDRVPPDAEVWAIDADAVVVRPGPRVVEGVEAIATILHPGRCGEPDPELVRRIR